MPVDEDGTVTKENRDQEQKQGNGQNRPTDETYGLPAILTVDETAAFLRLNRKTVFAAIAAKQMPGRRVGRRIVVCRDALLDWLRSDGSGLSSRRRGS